MEEYQYNLIGEPHLAAWVEQSCTKNMKAIKTKMKQKILNRKTTRVQTNGVFNSKWKEDQ